MTKLSRPLPTELLVEMHKCLPLANAIYVLVNVSKTFVLNNSTRMRRNIHQIKTSLNEYIGTLVNDGDDREELEIHNDIEWKSQLDALLRYGSWLTSAREFRMHEDSDIVGDIRVEELLLHLANSRSTQMMLNYVRLLFGGGLLGTSILPIPTFLKPLFKMKKEFGERTLFESIQLKTDNGQILQIFDAEYAKHNNFAELRLIVANKMDGKKNWFRILIDVDSSEEFIQGLIFSKWNMQPFDIANFIKEDGSSSLNDDQIEQNGNKLDATEDVNWSLNLDIILRRGAGFTQYRHFNIKKPYILAYDPDDYVDFLISSISNTNHPEDFLESIDMNLSQQDVSSLLQPILNFGLVEGIPKSGKLIEFDNEKLHILSAKIANPKNKWLRSSSGELEFTLVNESSTNGAYLFDFVVKLIDGFKQIDGIKIQKRKTDAIAELKCKDQIELGKKRKTNDDNEDDENEPTCLAKLMKK